MDSSSLASRRYSAVVTIAIIAILSAVAGCGDSSDVDGEGVELTIQSPQSGDYESSRTVQFEGTVQGSSSVQIEGVNADVNGDVWQADVSFDNNGPIEATATAGDARTSVEFTIDTTIPHVEIHSPERGTVIDAATNSDATVDLEGQVSDVGASGLELLDVDGHRIDVDDDGYFQTQVSVDEGFNLLTVTATDRALNRLETSRALLFGPLAEADEPIDKAARFDIDNPDGIDAITEVIEAYITPEQIHEFIVVGFEQGDIPVDITDVYWDELQLQLVPDDGLLDVEIQVNGLRVDGEFAYDDDSDPVEGFIEIEQLDVQLALELNADDDNQLDVTVVDDSISTQGVTVNIEGEEEGWLETATEIAIAVAFEQFVAELLEDNLYDPDVLTHEIEFLEQSIQITLQLEEIFVSSQGISIELGLEFPQQKDDAVATVPGALNRPVGGNLGGSVDRPVLFHTNRTAIDRVFHGIWRTGLFHQQLSNDELSAVQLPFDLTADGLASLLDTRIRNLHERETPAQLRLRPLLAPIVEFGDQQQQATAYVGDFLIDVLLLPEDDTETLVITLALHLEVDIEFQLQDNEIGFDLQIDAQGDIADEPQFRFDRANTVDFMTDIIEIVPDLMESDLAIDAAATLDWATFDNPAVSTHGADNDRLTIGVDIEAADGYIDDDEVDAN